MMISRRALPRLRLKTDSQPAVPFLVSGETAGGHGVGKRKERGLVAARLIESLDQEVILVVDHRLQTLAADIAIRRTVNRVAHRHVVGGNGFGHRARRAADPEEPARHFLPGADFGKGAVLGPVEVDLKRLLVGVKFLFVHEIGSSLFADTERQA